VVSAWGVLGRKRFFLKKEAKSFSSFAKAVGNSFHQLGWA
jgi:hypothetical protein